TWRETPERQDAEAVEHSLQHRADADDELQVVGLAHTGGNRRGSVGLDVDHELPIARGFGARVGESAKELCTLTRECREPVNSRLAIGQLAAKRSGLAVAAADEARLFVAEVVGADTLFHGRRRRGSDGSRGRHSRLRNSGSRWALPRADKVTGQRRD